MTVLIEAQQASRSYWMGEVEVKALREATLCVLEGEILVLLGPSGCGKSTLLNILGGMDRPTSGTVHFREQNLTTMNDQELTDYRRLHVGFVFQFYNLIPSLTALENVKVAAEIAPNPLDPLEALDQVGLKERARHFPSQMSGGEQQRVAIARALVTQPDFLLCDEPTGALDLSTSRRVLKVLLDANKKHGKTLVLVTHNAELARIANRVAYLRDGSVHSIDENKAPASVEDVSW